MVRNDDGPSPLALLWAGIVVVAVVATGVLALLVALFGWPEP